MKPVGYQQPTCLCFKMEFVVRTISLSGELYSLSKADFVHVGRVRVQEMVYRKWCFILHV